MRHCLSNVLSHSLWRCYKLMSVPVKITLNTEDMLVYLYLDMEYSSVKAYSSFELHPLKTFCFFELVNSFSSLFCKVLHDRGNTIIRKRKLTKEASIGRKMVAVATLEVNSVNMVIMIQTHITIA